MSYSINGKASNRSEARTQIKEKLEEVIKQQPIHNLDVGNVEKLAGLFLDQMGEEREGHTLIYTIYGSVSKQNADADLGSMTAHVELYWFKN